MKDILRFAGTTLLMLATLTLVGMIFVQSFMGDYEWLNITITAVYSLLVLAAGFYDGMQRGTQDCKFTSLVQKQQEERNHEITAQESQRMYKPMKGFYAGLLAASLTIILAIVMLFLRGDAALYMTPVIRILLGAFLSVFAYVENLLPWFYLPMALIYPALVGIGYLTGPAMWQRQLKIMEKAKKAKLRRVKRKRKVKKAS